MLPNMLEERDTRMKVHTGAKRKARADLQPLAHPQAGVDALKGKFPSQAQDIPGVAETQPQPPPK
jgi:hypothetical protein